MAKKVLPLEVFVRRLRVIPCLPGRVNEKKKLAFLAELTALGYEPQNVEAYTDSILRRHKTVINTLKKLKGAHVEYVPLFQGFPNEVPPEDEYFVRRLVGYVGNYFGMFSEGTGPELDNGMVVPEWLFNVEMFGADPISQFQDEGLYNKGVANQKKREDDSAHVLHPIRLVSLEEALSLGKKWLQDVFYANSSVKDSLRSDVEKLLHFYEYSTTNSFLDVNKIVFKETKAYIMSYFWKKGQPWVAGSFATSPTDFLRMFADLTDGDISLIEKIKYPKFSSTQRRMVLQSLEDFNNLAESLNRYRHLWLAIGRGLHPMAYENKYPNVYDAFNTLRNDKVRTWASRVEKALKPQSTKASTRRKVSQVLPLLEERPSEFARRLHRLLRLGRANDVLNSFSKVAHKVPLKTLFTLERYFDTVDSSDYRTIINKKGRVKIIENDLSPLDSGVKDCLAEIFEDSIKKRIADNKESWEDKVVWVDPQLHTFVAPFAQRKASEALISAGRGTRIPLTDEPVLRVFVYWKQSNIRTDLDLSLVAYDKDMNFLEHVSYTRLNGSGMVHSGDIQSAPHGAAEFIDVKLDSVPKKMAFVAPRVYKYSGESFDQCKEAFVGWMSRDKCTKDYKSFDVKTVENAFQLTRSAAYATPFLVDLKKREVVYVDLYNGRGNSYHNRVENSLDSVSNLTRECARFVETKPVLGHIAECHVAARGAILTSDKDSADITIGVKDCDFNAREIESVLNEFLC